METKQYSREQLESKCTSELEWHYMNAFKSAYKSGTLDTDTRLKTVTEILFNRDDFREKRIILGQIEFQLARAVQDENYESAAIFRDMQHHYEKHVLG